MTKFDPAVNWLFWDLDGCFADFEAVGEQILGMNTREYEQIHGSDKFYDALNYDGAFFAKLPLIQEMFELYWDVQSSGNVSDDRQAILSGIPWKIKQATVQKVDWVRENIDSERLVITPRSRDKYLYCSPGDIIVDDWPKHRKKWEEKGGHWVAHDRNDFEATRNQLKELGIL